MHVPGDDTLAHDMRVLQLSHQMRALLQGLDFFFANRQHAVKLVDFLQVFIGRRTL